ncbi:MliC family protein [Marinomonas sp. TI.3.20]|uniref:MliC family protein n=1 Tax=Marinomonas sp. TI.3.20 TaxID=3121296 RepID=UPI00311F23AF
MLINKKSMYCFFTGLALLGLTACSSIDTSQSTDQTFSQEDSQTDVADYLCTGMPLKVMFHGEEAQIIWKQKTYNLTQAISASGSHYLGEDISFWIKGKQAGLEIDDLSQIKCQLIRVES